MAGFTDFLQDLGNVATGGILGLATGRTKELQDQAVQEREALLNDPEKMKEAQDYKMSLGAKIANLATGGLYGIVSGDTQKQNTLNMIDQAKLQVQQDQIDQALYDRIRMAAPQPGGVSQWKHYGK